MLLFRQVSWTWTVHSVHCTHTINDVISSKDVYHQLLAIKIHTYKFVNRVANYLELNVFMDNNDGHCSFHLISDEFKLYILIIE